ncbi:hypothetical protein Ciccas_011150 [Cichlidogyrus casuarinus]|uniref:TOG domain-containing protein n=1 Tax=Cichlidogyrus casuarinus TaxID=1844966 RepID=A0ABD2PT84_9PLAT
MLDNTARRQSALFDSSKEVATLSRNSLQAPDGESHIDTRDSIDMSIPDEPLLRTQTEEASWTSCVSTIKSSASRKLQERRQSEITRQQASVAVPIRVEAEPDVTARRSSRPVEAWVESSDKPLKGSTSLRRHSSTGGGISLPKLASASTSREIRGNHSAVRSQGSKKASLSLNSIDLLQHVEMMESVDWSDKCSGMEGLLNICEMNPEVLKDPPLLQRMVKSLAEGIQSLRSQVSRNAIQLTSQLAMVLKPRNEGLYLMNEVQSHLICSALLSRLGGDASTQFLRQEAERALSNWCLNAISEDRAVSMLCSILQSDKCKAASMKKAGSDIVNQIVQNRKPLSQKTTEKVIQVANRLIEHGHTDIRNNGYDILRTLSQTMPGFLTIASKSLPSRDFAKVQKITKESGAKRHQPKTASLPRNKTKSTSCSTASVYRSKSQPSNKKLPPMNLEMMELVEKLEAPDWAIRYEAIEILATKLLQSRDSFKTDSNKLIDRLSKCILDVNARVSIIALKFLANPEAVALCDFKRKDHFSYVKFLSESYANQPMIARLASQTAAALASKNNEVYKAAQEAFTEYIKYFSEFH